MRAAHPPLPEPRSALLTALLLALPCSAAVQFARQVRRRRRAKTSAAAARPTSHQWRTPAWPRLQPEDDAGAAVSSGAEGCGDGCGLGPRASARMVSWEAS